MLPFLIVFILLMVVIVLSRTTYSNEKTFALRYQNSRRIIKLYDSLALQIRSAEIFSPSYKGSLAGEIYETYKADAASFNQNVDLLRRTISTTSEPLTNVDSIKALSTVLLPTLLQRNVPELLADSDTAAFGQLTVMHNLIRSGLKKEEESLNLARAELQRTNDWNNVLTLLTAAFAVAIIISTFFSQFFLSKRSRFLEGFLESVLNTSQNGILHVKAVWQKGEIADFKLLYANPASQSLLREEPGTLLKKRWTEIAALKDERLMEACKNVVRTGEAMAMEYLQHDVNSQRSFALSLARLDDGVTISFYEDTVIKATAEELRHNIHALQESNRELEEYAYAASHDLQEPLRKIKTFGGLLRDNGKAKFDERSSQHLDKILQSADRMSILIKDLLRFSSLKQREEPALTDLNEIFDHVVDDLEVAITQTRAIITHDRLPEIKAIPVQMNQLFYNLINNSLKFAKQDLPLHLDVSCTLLTEENAGFVPGLESKKRYYEIVFSDNGIGFSQDYAVQIFGLFKRLHDKSNYAGSGIGLALCKKVVMNHGGLMMANGKEGVGAQFYIYLPADLASEASTA